MAVRVHQTGQQGHFAQIRRGSRAVGSEVLPLAHGLNTPSGDDDRGIREARLADRQDNARPQDLQGLDGHPAPLPLASSQRILDPLNAAQKLDVFPTSFNGQGI